MVVFPHAKINLGLHILRKRPDGYHDIETVLYPIGWEEALEVVPAPEARLTTSGLPVPGDPAHNLCWRAYRALAADFDLPPVHIHLHKVIPMGAGLGGGSADAAFLLRLLRDRFALPLTDDDLLAYARPIGSDCAFFVRSTTALATDRGDVLAPVACSLAGCHLVAVFPGLAIGTAEAYAGVTPRLRDFSLADVVSQPVSAWRGRLENDFEESLFPRYPALAQLKADLYAAGAAYASLTGSGACVYGIFEEKPTTLPNFPAEYVLWEGNLQ